MRRIPAFLVVAALTVPALPLAADEGMWTFDNIPSAKLQAAYGFAPDAAWLEHARLASLRFNDGGSGSFVSAEGLVLTNHHVARGQLQKMSKPGMDYVKSGFYAKTRAEEIPCPDLEINQLQSYENVTERVLSAVPKDVPPAAANEARRAAIAAVEKECHDKTGLRCDVVDLYAGGEYWLYRYKKYTDVRLVMAPEVAAAYFGGDPDNFTYPRYDADFSFFRVYEDGKPVKPAQHFAFEPKGPADGELVFVTGHPGRTSRLQTVAQLAFERDRGGPDGLRSLGRSHKAYAAWSARGTEEARQAANGLFGVGNSLKARTGKLEGLQDPKLFAKKEAEEAELRARVAKDPALQAAYGGAWDDVEAATKKVAARWNQYRYYAGGYRGHALTGFAETLVRWGGEAEKPNGKRYEEFRESGLDSLRFKLFSKAPVYPGMEEFLLAERLKEYRDELGADDPFVKAALDGKTPEEAAAAAVRGTKLADPALRKALYEGGRKAVEASDDPLIAFARRLDPYYRQLRDWYKDEIESVETRAGEKIAKARFAVYGKGAYPDATFTLRLAYGKAAGYELGTTQVPYKTVYGGMFARADEFGGKEPFALPQRVAAARGKVDPKAPLDFVSTNDITGGNSGSPVVNKDLKLVGLIFDGNIQSLPNDCFYSEERARAVSVHAGGILTALKSIYGMDALAKELEAAGARADSGR